MKRFGDFSYGVPSTSTIARAMGMINATRLQKYFRTVPSLLWVT
ncbi:hypothetical protein VCRA219O19_80039 [Vibrio crassostreae]|nr:hypothetical protein VCRA219O19_80039 [Vibrio crassostreae]